MKKLSYIALSALALSACSDDKDMPGIQPTPGQDVNFSTYVNADEAKSGSRTTYADEATGTASWRINWLNGDMINIYSPQAETGFREAPYKVINATAEGADDNTLNYAKELGLVKDAGVRWGTATNANFYAVYPYVEGINNFTTVGTADEHTTITATVAGNQVNSVPTFTNTTTNNIFVKGDMPNNVMFAAETNVPNGTKTVNLQFHPVSTVLQIKLGCLSVGTSATGRTDADITIRKITVTAPSGVNITGDLAMAFGNTTLSSTPDITIQNGSNSVSLETRYNGTYITIPAGGTMTANMFITVPSDNSGYTIDNTWTITVDAIEGTFSKTLDNTTTAGKTTELLPGEIHQINLPKFNRDTEWKYEGGSWLSTIPLNVYVSELSLPGAWYAYDGSGKKEGYQVSNTSITQLFNAGVRAFHLETRVGGTSLAIPTSNNSTVVISGTGSTNPVSTEAYYLATSIEQPVKDIASAVASTTEFAVLVLNYTDGTSGGTNATWRGRWLSKLKSLIDGLGISNIYSESLTPNTTIKDVQGKLIILICVDNENEKNETAAQGINALFSYTQQSWSNMSASLISQALWKGWPAISNISGVGDMYNDNIYLNYTMANRTYSGTGTAPAKMPDLQDRKDAISSLIANSDVIYGQASHNLWILCGAGGTYAKTLDGSSDSNGPQNIASALNPFLLDAINTKIANSKPSPLGLVLVNRITDANNKGPELIQAIIEMNNKFYLQRDETASGGGDQSRTNYQSSMKVDTNGWNVF